jgi:N-dimethylarginine dimethylaminohydrolase
MGKVVEKTTDITYHEMYQNEQLHPQIQSDFGDEMLKFWSRKWKANTTIGKLRMILLHRPGKEILSIGKPTPWPPYDSSLAAWRMRFKPDLDEMVEHHENLVKAYMNEGVEVVIRKPDPFDPPRLVKSIYTDDVCHPSVYGQVILRMYANLRKGEEVPTFQTLAEIGCPVVGMITGNGMIEGGPTGWLDEKHLIIEVHYPRANTREPGVMRANEFGHQQFANIVKTQDPEVDIRFSPGYGKRQGFLHYSMIDRHTSVMNPKYLDPYLVEWMKVEMNWNFIVPPDEFVHINKRGMAGGPSTGVVLEPMKILVPSGRPKATKWLESIGVEVVEVDISSLVSPRNSGSIHCTAGSLIRDPEPAD